MATTLRRLAERAENKSAPDVYGTGALIQDFENRVADMLAGLPGVQVNPATPQSAMFHLHIELARDRLIQAVADYAEQHDVVVAPKPRAIDETGNSICEISVGRSTMEHPPEFWLTHLRTCLAGCAGSETNGKVIS